MIGTFSLRGMFGDAPMDMSMHISMTLCKICLHGLLKCQGNDTPSDSGKCAFGQVKRLFRFTSILQTGNNKPADTSITDATDCVGVISTLTRAFGNNMVCYRLEDILQPFPCLGRCAHMQSMDGGGVTF